MVLTHLRALAEHGNPGVTVVDGDVREPAEIVAAISGDIDCEAPACLMMGYLLHFFASDAARDLVASYVARLAPGSYVVLSVGRADGEVRNRVSVPIPRAARRSTTIRWKNSRASSAP